MEKSKRKISYLDKTLCLLSVILILLLVGVFTSPNNQDIMADKSSTSMVVNNQDMSSLSEIEDEDELIEFLEDNNIDLDYANYNLDNYYVVQFDSNGGTRIDSKLVEYGKTVSRPSNPVKSCYAFNGWYLNGEKFYFSSQIRDDITLEAKWTYNTECDKKDTFIVEFDSNGGDYVYSQTVIEDNKVIEPEEPTREGYEFNGWYLNGTKYNFNKKVTQNLVLEAKWTKVQSYTIKFDSNNGTYVETQYISYGNYVEEPEEPTREGYEFNGWYLNDAKYNFNKKVTQNLVLEAKWVKVYEEDIWEEEEYKVQFNSNGGTKVETQYITYKDYVNIPNIPTREGYIFDGWYLNGNLYDFDTEVVKDITLKAKWVKETEKYYEYCKVETETHYSISYVSETFGMGSYNWTIKFDNIDAKNLKVTDINYLTTTADYNNAYRYSYNKQISMVDGNSKYNVLIPSGNTLKNGSLKTNHFYKDLSTPYSVNGTWYVDAEVNIKDYYLAKPYYAEKLNNYIYFVPFKFEIQYVDLDNCEVDKVSKKSNYDGYTVVDTFYQ